HSVRLLHAQAARDADEALETSGAARADPRREERARCSAAPRRPRDAGLARAGPADAVRGAHRDELSRQVPARALDRSPALRAVGDELASAPPRPYAPRRTVRDRPFKRSASARRARAS